MSLRPHITLLLLTALLASADIRADGSDIGYPSPDAALKALHQDPKAEFSIKGGWTIVSTREDGNLVMWSFTPKDHPASPAAVKRTMIQKEDGSWIMNMSVLCGGPKTACDRLVEDFKQLNDRMIKDIHEHQGK